MLKYLPMAALILLISACAEIFEEPSTGEPVPEHTDVDRGHAESGDSTIDDGSSDIETPAPEQVDQRQEDISSTGPEYEQDTDSAGEPEQPPDSVADLVVDEATDISAPDLSEQTSTESATDAPAEQVSDIPLPVVTNQGESDDNAIAAPTPKEAAAPPVTDPDPAALLCTEIGAKLGSVDETECLEQGLLHSAFSNQQKSLSYKDYLPVSNRESMGRVMVIGGIHGDEFSSVSLVFKWMNILNEHHSGLFHWRYIPVSNPDGLLRKKSQRQNGRGVDLNRNFPTGDWNEQALAYWRDRTKSNPRRYPGETMASEPETQWLVEQIAEFKPDVIVSMHAPFHLVDYDGPPSAPKKLGGLYLRQLGVYPGSLGNYAGVDLQLPIVTVELKSAGIMPSDQEINRMWSDLIRWLRNQLPRTSEASVADSN